MKLVKKIDQKALIEENLSDYEIFEYYIGNNFQVGKMFCSQMRQDAFPSCNVFKTKYDRLLYKDLGSGEKLTAINYVKTLYNLNYPQTLDKIISDFGLMDIDFKAEIVKKDYSKEIIEKKKPLIQIIPKKFSEEDLEYWSSYGINSIETLKKFDIYSVDKVYLNKQEVRKKKEELVFTYFFKKSNNCKVYFPQRTKFEKRFLSNISNETDLQGYWQQEISKNKPNLLILTSSFKEVLFLYERGITSVALHGENHTPNPDLIRHLKKYSGKLLTLQDWDSAGVKSSEFYKTTYNIDYIEKPSYITCDSKDITDCWKYGDKEQVDRFIKEIKTFQT